MKNKIIKKILFILISIVLILNIPLYSRAGFSFDSLFDSADNFINEGNGSTAKGIDEASLKPLSDSIANILLVIAVGVTLTTAVMMAINFTVQSVEDKAKIKESMIPWVIGIFVTFGAFGIWKVTMTIFYGLV